MRFKQFTGSGLELERAVNAWLVEFDPDVTQMTQTMNQDGTVCLAILFEESFRGQERRRQAERDERADARAVSAKDASDVIKVPIEPGSEGSPL